MSETEKSENPVESRESERDPLTEKQTVTFDVEEGQGAGEIPKDKLNFVLLVMMLHGVGTLIAWNVFITIAPLVSLTFI